MDRYLSLFRNLWVVGGIIAAVIFVAALAAFGKGLNLEEWRNLALILGGVIALPLAVWRSGIAAKQVALIEAGLNTDRYQKGAAMLGDERLSVRQAGVIALAELAENNFKEYHVLVIKVLCLFIKDRSDEQRKQAEALPYKGKGKQSHSSGDQKQLITPDCQTALTSLSALSKTAEDNNCLLEIGTLDLNHTILQGATLKSGHLKGADLNGASLKGAHLFNINLNGASMKGANLNGANLEVADLEGAQLEGAQLEGANLNRASLKRAGLDMAQLERAQLNGASLVNARLDDANLHGAGLEEANLQTAFLLGSNLQGARLTGADLENAHLVNADLEGANLERANLKGAILLNAHLMDAELALANMKRAGLLNARLVGANLQGANLEGAGLKGADLERANLYGANLEGANLFGAIGLTSPQLETAENCDPAFLKGIKKAEKTQEGAED